MEGHEVYGFDLPAGDITDKRLIQESLDEVQPDEIYHIAGQAYLGMGEEAPVVDLKVNVVGTLNILEWMKGKQARMVFTSTGAVYGLSPLPHSEEMNPAPMCNYGISKLAAEKYIQKYAKTEGVDAKIVRFSSIYGAGRRAGPVNIFLHQARTLGKMSVYGSGGQTRDFVHVSDVCRAMSYVINRGDRGGVYNVGSGVETSVREVAHLVKGIYNDAQLVHIPKADGLYDLPRSWFNTTKIKNLGWSARMSLELGIRSTDFDEQQD